jgi:hypothetical protein
MKSGTYEIEILSGKVNSCFEIAPSTNDFPQSSL